MQRNSTQAVDQPDQSPSEREPGSPGPAPLRIIHIVKICNIGNGNSNVAVDLACTQARAGATVTFICAGGDFVDLLTNCGVTVLLIEHGHKSLTGNATAVSKMRSYFKTFAPDVIHTHMVASTVLAAVAARGLNIPVIATVHNSFDRQSALMRAAHRVVAVSMAEYDALIQRRFRNDRLSAVVNGTEGSLREQFLPKDTPVTLNKPCVVTACGLHGRKGADIVIAGFVEAAKDKPEWTLYIAGDGPDRAHLEKQARESGMAGRIHILGFRRQPREILDQADIFVIASYAEPCCLVLSEARNAGCAAVATAVGGNSELLDHGRAGRLVPPGNPGALARELSTLMGNPDLLAAAKTASREGNEVFNLDRVCRDYESVYRISMVRDVPRKSAQPQLKPQPASSVASAVPSAVTSASKR